MTALPGPLPFVPISELSGRPHIVVDGAPRRGTVLTLSHWPGTPTPRALWRDLSAEIVLAYLERGDPSRGREGSSPDAAVAPRAGGAGDPGASAPGSPIAVTSDHLDVDGLVSLYGIVDPEGAWRRRKLLVEVARAGDFAIVTDAVAGRVAFALTALIGTAGVAGAPGPYGGRLAGATGSGETAGEAYRELLGLLPELLDHPERFSEAWSDEEASLEAGRAAARGDRLRIDDPGCDGLVVVRLATQRRGIGTSIGHGVELGVHPAAIHELTNAVRVLVLGPEHVVFYDRYESWVRIVSRRVPLRRDLGALAPALSATDPSGVGWEASSPGSLVPVLRPADGGPGGLDPGEVIGRLSRHLATAPPAWDPSGVSEGAASRSGTSGRGRLRRQGRWKAQPSA